MTTTTLPVTATVPAVRTDLHGGGYLLTRAFPTKFPALFETSVSLWIIF